MIPPSENKTSGRYRRAARIHGRGWIFTRMLGGLLTGAVTLAGFGVGYETVSAKFDLSTHPAPGLDVPIDDHRLHLDCAGSGKPTVLLEADVGEWSIHWQPVFERLARRVRVCAYDRAGYGWSTEGPHPRNADRNVRELRELLYLSKIATPVVLVARGRGAVYGRTFARRFPQAVSALLLVPGREAADAPGLKQVKRHLPAAYFAWERLNAPPGWALQNLPPDARWQVSRAGYYSTLMAELDALEQDGGGKKPPPGVAVTEVPDMNRLIDAVLDTVSRLASGA
ncbi:MAG: alpha/beta fold hydrolase [Leptospirillia bacterium]